ncbi:VOC family protein [Cellulomonas sp. URHE0023]|uniref:VOC family protein n=1 Tax=Cellulomonas sp. URHE0023 TaxID=1380354 RepID=UPI00048581D1|nr:VOC family protein [Cellulomonas sp. URHE0023]
MPTTLNPYLNFRSNAKEALTFYANALGGELVTSTFGEGGMSQSPADADLIMHGQITSPSGLVLMAADTPEHMEWSPTGNVAISLSGEDRAELTGYWDKLAEGATITAPLETAPWGDTFGMLVDKFGTSWLVNISAPAA